MGAAVRTSYIFAGLIWVLLLGVANAAEQLQFGPPDAWVEEAKIPSPDPDKKHAPYQFLLLDTQSNFAESRTESYVRTVIKVQSPEGLGAAGNVALSWHPDTGEVKVHHLSILRGKEVINVLDQGQRFSILRREPNLEAATIDGVLTAAMQPSGIQVGDIVDFAYTQTLDNPVFGGTASHTAPFMNSIEVRQLKVRYQWPESRDMKWQTSSDLPSPKISETKTGRELSLRLTDIVPPTDIPENAPTREYLTGLLEISDISEWATISSLMAPLYQSAAELSADSLLKAEAAKIAAETDDPVKRAERALRLVQDQIRYLFLGIDAGAYIPASADETWARRFGDCKAKTVVLLALLQELGIDAEPALVSSSFGDGLDQRLPSFAVFDHVIVKATIGDVTHWLDGTRIGDRQLKYIVLPGFNWALPIRQTGAQLEQIDIPPLDEPAASVFLEIDGGEGFIDKTPAKGRMIVTGDTAILLRQQMSVLAQEQAQEARTAMWQAIDPDIEPDQSDIVFDEASPIATTTFSGHIELEKISRANRQFIKIPGSRIGWDVSQMEDEVDERTAPWLLAYPLYRQDVVTIILPKDRPNVMLKGGDIDTVIGGVELKRKVHVEGGAVTMTSSTRTTQAELPANSSAIFISAMKAAYENDASFGLPKTGQSKNEKELDRWKSQELITAEEYIRRGSAFLNAARFDDAITDFSEAIALDEDNSAPFSDRGLALHYLQRYDEAAADFEQAVELDANNWVGVYGQGLTFAHNENYAAAIDKFNASLDINPDYLIALATRAYAKIELDDIEGAINDMRHYLERLPQDIARLPQLASLLQGAQRYDEAIAVIDRAIAAEPVEYNYFRVRADIYEDAGNLELALSDYDQVVKLSKKSSTALNNRCWFRVMNNIELEKALKDCNQAIKTDPDNINAYDSRGYVHLRLNDQQNAITDFNSALAIEPDLAASLYGRGLAKLRIEDDSGNADIAQAIELDSTISSYFEEYGLTE